MNIVVIHFNDGSEFSFKCDEATFKTDNMTGELSGYSFKGFHDKKPLFFRMEDVEYAYSILQKEGDRS